MVNQTEQKIIDECENETNTYLCEDCTVNKVCPKKQGVYGAAKCEAKQYELMYGSE